jgi:hypothetical protein
MPKRHKRWRSVGDERGRKKMSTMKFFPNPAPMVVVDFDTGEPLRASAHGAPAVELIQDIIAENPDLIPTPALAQRWSQVLAKRLEEAREPPLPEMTLRSALLKWYARDPKILKAPEAMWELLEALAGKKPYDVVACSTDSLKVWEDAIRSPSAPPLYKGHSSAVAWRLFQALLGAVSSEKDAERLAASMRGEHGA